jgi:hypothetical protein
MEQNYSNRKPLRDTIKEMGVGDIIHFPVTKTSVIRSTTSTLNLEMGRKYKSRLNRETMTIDVTREA